MEAELLKEIELLTGKSIASTRPVKGGYTEACRVILPYTDTTSAFLKAAVNELTAGWLKDEKRMYEEVSGNFMPKVLYSGEYNGLPFLLLEDLSHATWPPPWNKKQIAEVISTLDIVHAQPAPEHLGTLEEFRKGLGGWEIIQQDISGFLALGICTKEWLLENLPIIVDAERKAVLEGDSIVHLDLRSDNLCFVGDRTVLIDWNHSRRGNGKLDLISWLPSLAMETDIAPWDLVMDEPEILTMLMGYFARTAYISTPRPGLQELRIAMLKAGFPWMCKSLNIKL